MALFVVVVASVNLVVIQEPGANPNGRHNLVVAYPSCVLMLLSPSLCSNLHIRTLSGAREPDCGTFLDR